MRTKHSIVLHQIKRSGCRTTFTILLNEKELKGLVVRTMSKGKEVWWTIYKNERLPYYNPEWLCHKNNRRVNLTNTPFMRQAVAYLAEHPNTQPIDTAKIVGPYVLLGKVA